MKVWIFSAKGLCYWLSNIYSKKWLIHLRFLRHCEDRLNCNDDDQDTQTNAYRSKRWSENIFEALPYPAVEATPRKAMSSLAESGIVSWTLLTLLIRFLASLPGSLSWRWRSSSPTTSPRRGRTTAAVGLSVCWRPWRQTVFRLTPLISERGLEEPFLVRQRQRLEQSSSCDTKNNSLTWQSSLTQGKNQK